MKTAKVENPFYNVQEMTSDDFLDFSVLSDKKFWTDKRTSHMSEIKVFSGKKLKIKYDFAPNETEIKINFDENTQLNKCYPQKLKVDKAKKQDLNTLMAKWLIPEKYHAFYKQGLD